MNKMFKGLKEEFNIFKTDLILTGDLFSEFFYTTLATLQVSYLLQDKNIYQTMILMTSIIGILINTIVISKDVNKSKKFYKYKDKLFAFEIFINSVLIPITLLISEKQSLIVIVVASILMKPFNLIQKINLKIMISEIYDPDNRTRHDLLMQKYSSFVGVLATVAGYVANTYIEPKMSMAILLFIEIVNNAFYMKQKPLNDDKE